MSARKKPYVTEAMMLEMCKLRDLDMPYAQIAKLTGAKHHSTVFDAIERAIRLRLWTPINHQYIPRKQRTYVRRSIHA